MRKVILFNAISIDGFFAGPNGEIDWHNVDEEFNVFANEQLNAADGLLFGRVTYQFMAEYWPTPAGIKDDPIIANMMNRIPKIVFSKTLEKVKWENTRLIKENIEEEILKLKRQAGKDLFIFGSGDLATTLMKLGLIDEYRLLVNPVILGSGQPLFKNMQSRLKLKLLRTMVFRNGNVLLYYQPEHNQPVELA